MLAYILPNTEEDAEALVVLLTQEDFTEYFEDNPAAAWTSTEQRANFPLWVWRFGIAKAFLDAWRAVTALATSQDEREVNKIVEEVSRFKDQVASRGLYSEGQRKRRENASSETETEPSDLEAPRPTRQRRSDDAQPAPQDHSRAEPSPSAMSVAA